MTEQDLDGPDLASVLIVVVVAALVGYTGLQVIGTVDQSDLDSANFEQQEQNITDGCMGVAGCGTGTWGLIPVAGIAGVLAIILGNVIAYVNPPEDDLQETKRLYVEGEIGILELEERLDDEMENDE